MCEKTELLNRLDELRSQIQWTREDLDSLEAEYDSLQDQVWSAEGRLIELNYEEI